MGEADAKNTDFIFYAQIFDGIADIGINIKVDEDVSAKYDIKLTQSYIAVEQIEGLEYVADMLAAPRGESPERGRPAPGRSLDARRSRAARGAVVG